MAAIDFKKLMAEELAKAKAKAFGKNKDNINEEKKERIDSINDINNNENLKEFMDKHLHFDELFVGFDSIKHKLANTNSAYYIPNFLSESYSNYLLSLIYSAPSFCWTKLKRRKLQCWGGKANINNLNKFEIEKLPIWCSQLFNKLNIFGNINYGYNNNNNNLKFSANHILINEYLFGEGILSHRDGPLYFPRVIIISLISSLCINFYLKP
eukprot:5206_1